MRAWLWLPVSFLLGCPAASDRDAAGDDVPPVDAPYLGYCPEAAFPSAWNRSCGAPRDCFVAAHTRNCCGGEVLFGIATSERARFDTAEARVRSTCPPACDCLSGVVLDDGSTVSDPRVIVADCVAGTCVARFATR